MERDPVVEKPHIKVTQRNKRPTLLLYFDSFGWCLTNQHEEAAGFSYGRGHTTHAKKPAAIVVDNLTPYTPEDSFGNEPLGSPLDGPSAYHSRTENDLKWQKEERYFSNITVALYPL